MTSHSKLAKDLERSIVVAQAKKLTGNDARHNMSTRGLEPFRRQTSIVQAKRDLLAVAARQFAHGCVPLEEVEKAARAVEEAKAEKPRNGWAR